MLFGIVDLMSCEIASLAPLILSISRRLVSAVDSSITFVLAYRLNTTEKVNDFDDPHADQIGRRYYCSKNILVSRLVIDLSSIVSLGSCQCSRQILEGSRPNSACKTYNAPSPAFLRSWRHGLR